MTDHANPQPDNLFGICHRIGEDFGFNPLWLRIGFGGALVFAPVAVIAAYFALGLVVLTSRVLFPQHCRRSATVTSLPVRAEPAPLPLAA